ncbi:hypothetical protein SAMN04487772_10880 [[Clostridium] polysaccharolyticum]|uniref:PAP2 superfamily protein n=1 Tax=[Clostridium] polysaccharolyticum TaxID=29364 RepID=A0A1I0BUI8_9FIRM|nr:hypothetical protein SAMN04487772_10880 [[Clostridium] polysaccharolyticum]
MRFRLKNYAHAKVFLYLIVYFIWFILLEQHNNRQFNMMYCKIDDYIPFLEVFVIPYILWFAYICVAVGYLLLFEIKDFYQCTAFLFAGMTICLIIYTVCPNAQALRVDSFPRNNLCTRLVKMFYTADTSTNVCPSIHVYNSIGAHIAVWRCKSLKKHPIIQYGSLILMILICLSTMFIKQHSFIDFICGIGLAVIMYVIIYKTKLFSKLK